MTERLATNISNTSPNGAISTYLHEPELRELIEFGRHLSESESIGLALGSRLGRYVVKEKIGAGGFGLVYLANDPTLNREVVIKVQKSVSLGTGLDEARTVALLNHPNVVPVHDVVEMSSNSWAMVMPQIEGASVRYTGDISQTVNYLVQAAGALAHIHASGYVHQDIKPANILVDHNGNAIVCDFGLAVNEQANERCEAGSPPYMSPEQIHYGIADRRSDVWSFGVVMFELLSGDRPFAGRNRKELFHTICSVEPPDLVTVNPRVPRRIGKICSKCLEKSPEDRFTSAEELYCQLLNATKLASKSRRSLLFVTASSVVVLFFVFWGWILAQRGATLRVREFLASDGPRSFELFSALPAGERIDNLLLQESTTIDDVMASRAWLAIAARSEDAHAVIGALASILERDRQLFLDIMNSKPSVYLAHLEGQLEATSSARRNEALLAMMLVAPENKKLNQTLSDESIRVEFLSIHRDWSIQIDRLLEIITQTDQPAVLATALSIIGEQKLGHNPKVIEAIASVREHEPNAEIHSLCNWISGISSERKRTLPKSIWNASPTGIHLVSVSINQLDYWVADSETTVRQYAAVRSDYKVDSKHDNPITRVSWYEAIDWCNQLSILEDLEPCYLETHDVEVLKSTVNGRINVTQQSKWDFRPENSGYRLPTVEEWKAIVPANWDSISEKETRLKIFANFQSSSIAPSRSRTPNKHGLFDLFGNVSEWCWDRSESTSTISQGGHTVSVNVINRATMGGNYTSNADQCCQDDTLWLHPESRYPMIGFRVMRLRN